MRRHWYLAVTTTADQFCGIAGFDHRRDGLGEFGWYLASPWWGRGLATAATAMLLEFGFSSVAVPALTATWDPDNEASRRVLENSGLWCVSDETIDTWRGPRPRMRFLVTRDEYGRTSERRDMSSGLAISREGQ